MTNEDFQGALSRGRSLLRQERAGPLKEVSPEVAPQSLGAIAGIGFETKDSAVRVSIYVIPGSENQAAAARRLREMYPKDPIASSKITSNGPLLLFGRTTPGPLGGSDDSTVVMPEYRLAQIVQAFAGDE